MTRIHFVGMGGAGMSAVARLLAGRGYEVTGSDKEDTDYLKALREAGMTVTVGHRADAVDGADVVVSSSAIRASNPELERASALGIDHWHRSQALAAAVEDERVIAVAGSHGKTTTSAMTAHLLHAAGIDATFAVGAKVLGVAGAVAGGYSGSAGVAVVEADESDGTFLIYRTDIAIVLNIEPEHLDHYGTVEKLHEAFTTFALGAGLLIACSDDPVVVEVAQRAREHGVEVTTFGTADADVVVTDTALVRDGREFPMTVPIPGDHHRLNAAAAWIAATAVGADPDAAAEAMATYGGTGRRFQQWGEVAGVRVVDDYAHHPTELAALIRTGFATGATRLIVLFQSSLYSRTEYHAAGFGEVLGNEGVEAVIAGIDPVREDLVPGVGAQMILDHVVPEHRQRARVVEDLREAARVAAELAQPGDLVVTAGSGTVAKAPAWILEDLRKRWPDE